MNVDKAFRVFVADPMINLPIEQARELFDEIINNTKGYLIDNKILF